MSVESAGIAVTDTMGPYNSAFGDVDNSMGTYHRAFGDGFRDDMGGRFGGLDRVVLLADIAKNVLLFLSFS